MEPKIGTLVLFWRAEDELPKPFLIHEVRENRVVCGASHDLKSGWEAHHDVQYGPGKQGFWGFSDDYYTAQEAKSDVPGPIPDQRRG